MRFWIGFIFGVGVGAAVVSTLDEDQRRTLKEYTVDAARSGRTGDVASTVRGGVGSIADEATVRVNDAIDSATTTVAEAIVADESTERPAST